MSKFFTCTLGLLLVLAPAVLVSEQMISAESPPFPPPASAEAADQPGPLRMERFAALGKKSPFTLASAVQENADFAKELTLAGYVRMDGQDFVMVANRTRPDRIMVGTKPSPSAQGMILVKIDRDPSGDPTKMQARVRKGTEEATLKYEAAAPTAAPPAVPGQSPIPGQPQAVPVPGQPGQKNTPVIRRRVIPIPAPPR
jgi:hypothetical protein